MIFDVELSFRASRDLDDEASFSLASGTPPFTGRFQPAETLTLFDGLDPNGVWVLEILDHADLNEGSLVEWELEFRFNVLPGDVDRNGEVSVADGLALRTRMFTLVGHQLYDPAADFDGDGTTDIVDGLFLQQHLFDVLPAGDPHPGGSAGVHFAFRVRDGVFHYPPANVGRNGVDDALLKNLNTPASVSLVIVFFIDDPLVTLDCEQPRCGIIPGFPPLHGDIEP